MAPKTVLHLALVAVMTCTTNSMPTKGLSVRDSPGPLLANTPAPEILETPKDHVPQIPQKMGESAVLEKRSVQENEKNLWAEDKNVALDNSDDLETAAGTNILRPLFVYRQQLAYRERVRKAGRRAAPNF